MGGVSIDPPAQPQMSVNPHVLMELFGGNETIQARVKQYQQSKADAEKALADLGVGKDARAALDDAIAKQKAADVLAKKTRELSEQAAALLAGVNDMARDIVADAGTKIAKLAGDVSAKVKLIEAELNKVRRAG